jgi:hypothetical protein
MGSEGNAHFQNSHKQAVTPGNTSYHFDEKSRLKGY